MSLNIGIFIDRATQLHNNKYGYFKVKYKNSKTTYKNNYTKLCIICNIHGEYFQTSKGHLNNKNGCPICKLPYGEREILKYLNFNKIKFTHNKKFEECYYKNKLPFDFYLPDYNICIEFDGIQHFEPVKYFGGEKTFEKQIIKDSIKTNFCFNNKINLLRIKYNDNIINILKDNIK